MKTFENYTIVYLPEGSDYLLCLLQDIISVSDKNQF